MHSSQEDQSFRNRYEDGSLQQPGAAVLPNAPTEQFPWNYPDGIESIDPFARMAAEGMPGSSARRSPTRPTKGKPHSGVEGSKFGRRKLVTLLAAGTIGAVTVVTVGGISLAHSPGRAGGSDDGGIATVLHKKPGTGTNRGDDTGEHGGGDGERDDGDGHHRNKGPHTKPTPSPTQTGTPSPTTTPSPTKTPTPPPPTPTPAGTVIGKTSQTTNTAVEQACTHAGVQVKYNPATGQFNCPAHGAIFNADGTNPQAPATRPLPPVHITVSANGTITTP